MTFLDITKIHTYVVLRIRVQRYKNFLSFRIFAKQAHANPKPPFLN